jgi:hypothetical protein
MTTEYFSMGARCISAPFLTSFFMKATYVLGDYTFKELRFQAWQVQNDT